MIEPPIICHSSNVIVPSLHAFLAFGVIGVMALVAAVAYFYPEKILCVDSGPVTADVIVLLGGGSQS